jgi:hypothetical protein
MWRKWSRWLASPTRCCARKRLLNVSYRLPRPT